MIHAIRPPALMWARTVVAVPTDPSRTKARGLRQIKPAASNTRAASKSTMGNGTRRGCWFASNRENSMVNSKGGLYQKGNALVHKNVDSYPILALPVPAQGGCTSDLRVLAQE